MLFTEREAFIELADALLEVQEKSGGMIFIDYSPHVRWISVRVYPLGHGEGKGESFSNWYYLDDELSVGNCFKYIATLGEHIVGERSNSDLQKKRKIASLRAELSALEG